MNEKPQTLKPFGRLCMTIGQLPASYVESMSYYEQLIWLTKFLQEQVIPVVNNNSQVTQELQDYVLHYFDNLDVQEEINNKLDEMADSGQLTDIIAQYLGLAGMITFNSVAEMKAAQNLVNGSKCQTLGYYAANDGGNAIYKIRNVTNADTIDERFIIALYDENLVAELIVGNEIILEQLGAYGDGTHDDTTALHSAITYADTSFKPIKALKKYYITSSFNVENLTNGYININGETPPHNYYQVGVYGYNIGGIIILNDIPLLTGNKTRHIRGGIRNITLTPITKNTTIDLFEKIYFDSFHFNNLSIFYFRYILNNCLSRASCIIDNCIIQFIESLIYGGDYVESRIINNYITGVKEKNSSFINSYIKGTILENNFIEYFKYIITDQVNNRVLNNYVSSNNTYDQFGTFFGYKSDDSLLNFVALNSNSDIFSNWSEAHAIVLPDTNLQVYIKNPIVKPYQQVSFLYNGSHINANQKTYLYVDNIINEGNTNQPTIDVTFWSTNQQNKRIYIENMEYVSVDSLPSFSYVGRHVLYNDELYCYVKSGTWKQLS